MYSIATSATLQGTPILSDCANSAHFQNSLVKDLLSFYQLLLWKKEDFSGVQKRKIKIFHINKTHRV